MGSVWVIVVAAGSGSRFGRPKQYEELGGRRVLDWSLAAARDAVRDTARYATGSDRGGVVAVVAPDRAGDREPAADAVVAGAATRSASVRAGLAAVPADAEVVVVHDGARPLADAGLFARVIAAVREGGDAAVPAVDVTDTLRHRSGRALDRGDLVAVQTPQGFRAAALRSAHAGDPEATDDASLVEAAGGKVVVVDGSPANLKITRPIDLAVAEALLGRGTPP
jgi:2-C-methyl-D-erythritol 4-phosphate cytidylyltransferase